MASQKVCEMQRSLCFDIHLPHSSAESGQQPSSFTNTYISGIEHAIVPVLEKDDGLERGMEGRFGIVE